jgi:hypothetical protein
VLEERRSLALVGWRLLVFGCDHMDTLFVVENQADRLEDGD